MKKLLDGKHTPGPWHANQRTGGVHALDAGGEYLRNVVASVHFSKEERDANMHLLSAAPDLLNALSAMLVNYGYLHALHDLGDCQATIDARAALDKARGEN